MTAAACTDDSDGVGLGTASRADVTEVVDAPATVTARAVATLSSPADGTLATLYVEPGASVTPGQILAVIDSPAAQQRLASAEEALDALDTGGSSGGGVRDLSAAQNRTDSAAAAAFAQAREAANGITDQATRDALLAQVTAAEAAYREASASARALIVSVQRGLASVSQAMNALTAAQRTQAKAAYDLAKTTVDALTLRAPVAGVVQLGGPATSNGLPSITDLLGSQAGALGAASGATGSGAAAGTGTTGPGIDPAPAVGTRVSAGTTILTVVDLTGRNEAGVNFLGEAAYNLMRTGDVIFNDVPRVYQDVKAIYGSTLVVDQMDGKRVRTSLYYNKGHLYIAEAIVLPERGDKDMIVPSRFDQTVRFPPDGRFD